MGKCDVGCSSDHGLALHVLQSCSYHSTPSRYVQVAEMWDLDVKDKTFIYNV